MKVTEKIFGTLSDGCEVKLFTISNENMSFSCTDYGCTLTSIVVGKEKKTDVLLGFSTLEGWLNTKFCFGAVVGRFANRIGKASFDLNGKTYQLDKNDGPNTLHGGFEGYDKMLWSSKVVKNENSAGVTFTRLSPDGEQGFPGNLELSVTYLLDENNNLNCIYNAKSDQDTPINLTNHAYFNLAGKGSIYNHLLKMNSSYRLDVNSKLIPKGNIVDVSGTPFDFTQEKTIGQDIQKVGVGYDHCYVTEIYNPEKTQTAVPLSDDDLVEFCSVKSPETNIEMTVFTNMEGCQFYTGNFINGIVGKNGDKYQKHGAFCLETQAFPDSPNKEEFPSSILKAGQEMKSKTIYSFKIN